MCNKMNFHEIMEQKYCDRDYRKQETRKNTQNLTMKLTIKVNLLAMLFCNPKTKKFVFSMLYVGLLHDINKKPST